MKKIVVLFLFLFSVVLNGQQLVNIHSENDWVYVPDLITQLDSSNTFSVLTTNGTQVFSSNGFTTPLHGFPGQGYMQTTWRKIFIEYPVMPDTFAIDLRVVGWSNLSEIMLGLALQDSFFYSAGLKQSFGFGGDWQTLKFETGSWFNIYHDNFIRFYLVFFLISPDSSIIEINAKVEVDNFRGIDTLGGIVVYDDFGGPSLVLLPIEQIPTGFVLEQNYPNPFNPSTTIKFTVPEQGQVNLTVFNFLGQEIKILVSEELGKGVYETSFDASELPSGVYFYRLQTGNFIETKKMIFLK